MLPPLKLPQTQRLQLPRQRPIKPRTLLPILLPRLRTQPRDDQRLSIILLVVVLTLVGVGDVPLLGEDVVDGFFDVEEGGEEVFGIGGREVWGFEGGDV